MKPAPFRYHDPTTVAETLALLVERGDGSKILAGGQSLIPVMSLRLGRPADVVDINKVVSLDYLRQENGGLAIGALTRQRTVELSEVVGRLNPLLIEASHQIGHIAIRNRGTVCGSLAHADPAAEWPALSVAMDATIVIEGASGRRQVAASDFFLSYFTTCLAQDEMLIEVRVPALPPGAGWSFLEVSRREGDFALVGVAAWLGIDGQGVCTDCAVSLLGVGPCAVRARGVEQRLRGEALNDQVFVRATHDLPKELEPDSDVHASADYRRAVAAVLTRRALATARRRAKAVQ
jgi:carbon-monoxide dehydrogenase medium subunit